MSRKAVILITAIVAIVVGSGIVLLRYKEELAARGSATRGSLVAITASGLVEYAEKGSGVPLLSIHGAGGGYDQGLANAAALVGESFRVIAPSRFGYLGTPVP